MKVAFLLGLLLVIAAPALAQGDNATTTGPATNSTNSTAPTNATGNGTEPAATPAGPVEFTLEGHQDGGAFYWTLAGATDHNPTLHVEPGQQVTFHVKSVSGLHNFKVGDLKASAPFDEGASIDVSWTAPAAAGSVTYICTIHGAPMSGKIVIGAAASGGGASGGGAGNITGETVDLGDVGFPQCAGVKVPAVAEKHVTGGPTLADYAAHCHGGAVSTGRAASQADLVIPVSFGLIALGIVATIWVHRAYKP